MSKGKLVVLEGLDGSGKATQAKLLEAHLKEQGFSVREITLSLIHISEPTRH